MRSASRPSWPICAISTAKGRERLKREIEAGLSARIAQLNKALATVKDLAQNKFDDVIGKIRRDLMIFSGINTAVFAILLTLTFLRREFARPLAAPASLMLVATVAAAAIYTFGQNWFFTILFDDYVGYGYLTYVALISLLLWDIVLNRARIISTFGVSICSPC